MDVLNYTEAIKISLASKCDRASLARYSSASTQVTLTTLAGAAATAGWGAATASGLGLGASYIFALGNIIDAKGHARAYEQAWTEIDAAESDYLRQALGMKFVQVNGKWAVDNTGVPDGPTTQIPSSTRLTSAGETLRYRVGKIIKVLDDVLAGEIPNLEDMQAAKNGVSANAGAPPVNPGEMASGKTTKTSHTFVTHPASSDGTQNSGSSTSEVISTGSASQSSSGGLSGPASISTASPTPADAADLQTEKFSLDSRLKPLAEPQCTTALKTIKLNPDKLPIPPLHGRSDKITLQNLISDVTDMPTLEAIEKAIDAAAL